MFYPKGLQAYYPYILALWAIFLLLKAMVMGEGREIAVVEDKYFGEATAKAYDLKNKAVGQQRSNCSFAKGESRS
jgi:hypothetical protein